MRLILLFFLVITSLSCSGSGNNAKPNVNAKTPSGPVPVYGYEVVKAYPHDPKAFTEGLFFYDGFLYESTGEEGRSSIRKVEIETGKVVQKWDLPREDFGEGISLLGDKIYMLTWRGGLGRVFDAKDFKVLREFKFDGEGWGMTTDGTNFIMSDGTHILKVMEPQNFTNIKKIAVLQDNGKPLFLLNELEYVKGEIWSNVWHSEENETGTTQGRMPNIAKPNYIARIDPNSGKLLGWIDLGGISPEDQGGPGQMENTLNGIAYDAANDRIFVTGKNWKKLYEIKITAPKGQ